jgi:hypothetical protein
MASLRKPDDFYKEGSKVFRRAPVNRESIQGWINIAKGKIADAQRVENSASTRLGAAYDSVLNLCFAVLGSKGWRCTSADGHHAQALEAGAAYAGVTEGTLDRVDAIRDMRNNQYQGVEPSAADVRDAIAAMERMVPELLALIPPN